MKKLRLLVTEACHKSCAGCCNKEWNLKKLPQVVTFNGFDEVSITGGEPTLLPVEKLIGLLREIAWDKYITTYLYTANVDPTVIVRVVKYLCGITFTLHDQEDADKFAEYDKALHAVTDGGEYTPKGALNLRLNVFKGITIPDNLLCNWTIRPEKEWIKNCPLPEDEVFMRL